MLIVTDRSPFVPLNGVVCEVMTEETVDDIVSNVAAVNGSSKSCIFYIVANSDTPDTPLTAGEITLETSSDPLNEEGWAELEAIDLTTIVVVGDHGETFFDAIGLSNGALRARITETVTGGSVSVRLLTQR